MKEVKRKWDLLSKEERQFCIERIIRFFEQEKSEEIGVIAAGSVLDCFLQNAAETLYNKGVEDSKGVLRQHLEDSDVDLEVLIK